MQYNYDYFISYAHKDNVSKDGAPGFVDKFVEMLLNSEDHKEIFGEDFSVFFDKTEIHNMSDWDNRIRSCLANSRFLIVLLSPNYFNSEYCAREFDWWMKNEMHRCTLGEGTAPMLIVDVASLQDPKAETIPDIPAALQARFPNWLKQIRKIQSDCKFDMHDFLISKIDDVLKTLRDEVKDKVRHQEIVDSLPYDTYPGYNENFVGRRENLLSLRHYISTKSGKVITALTGLGGFGKTELALTYGHAFGWDYQLGRFFKSCENCHSIYDAFLTCGILEKYGWKPKGTDEEQLLFVFNHLKEERDKIICQNAESGNLRTEGAHMLLILDNVNSQELISQLLKLNLPDFIHVMITTRENMNSFPGVHIESVERLSEDESVELLNNLRLFDNPDEAQAARKIAQLLAGFTLAVELTGAYLARSIRNPHITYKSQYERLFNNHAETFQKMTDRIGDLKRHTAETVSAVLESTLSALSNNALQILEFASLMSPDAVAVGWLPDMLSLNEDEWYEVFDELTGYSLLTPLENEPNIARIHRLVADSVMQEMTGIQLFVGRNAIWARCNALLEKDETFWFNSENSWNIVPVSEFCMMYAEHWTVESDENDIDWDIAWTLNASGDVLANLGKMNETRKVYKRCFEICEERFKKFPRNHGVLQNLGVCYDSLGDLERSIGNAASAREWYEKAQKIDKLLVDEAPDDVLKQLNLSASYAHQGHLEKEAGNIAAAREWYKKSLIIDQTLVDMRPDDSVPAKKLSSTYMDLADLEINPDVVRDLYKKGMEVCQQWLMKKPEDVGFLLNLSAGYGKFGNLERDCGNVAAAKECYEKSQEILQKLAELTPEDVGVQRNLSVIYDFLGALEQEAENFAVARDWFEKGLKISKRLAELLPDNVKNQRDLAISFERLGDLENDVGNAIFARNWFEKALAIYEKLAEAMPENVIAQLAPTAIYERFGDFESDAGNADAARAWFEKALEIDTRLAEIAPENADIQDSLKFVKGRLEQIQKS